MMRGASLHNQIEMIFIRVKKVVLHGKRRYKCLIKLVRLLVNGFLYGLILKVDSRGLPRFKTVFSEGDMEVQINDKFYLRTDPHNFIIAIKGKDGDFINLGYYGNLEHAMSELVNKQLMQSTAKTLEELKAEIEKIKAEIREAVGKLVEVK